MNEGQIYFAKSDDLIKIGFSLDPPSRMWTIPPPNGGEIHLLGTMPGSQVYEKELHQRFATHRVNGEWFRVSSEILDFIEAHTSPSLISVPARKLARQNTVMMNIPVRKEVRDQVRALALQESSTAQAMVYEALNLLFEKYGKKPIA